MQKNTRCLYNIIIKQNRKLHSRIWRQIAWYIESRVIRREAECFLEKLIISETEHLTEHWKQFDFRVKCDGLVSTAMWREESCKQQRECYSKMHTSFLCCQHVIVRLC